LFSPLNLTVRATEEITKAQTAVCAFLFQVDALAEGFDFFPQGGIFFSTRIDF